MSINKKKNNKLINKKLKKYEIIKRKKYNRI